MKTLLSALLLCTTIWLAGCDEKKYKEEHPEYVTWTGAKDEDNETILRRKLAYLTEIPEVNWVKFDGNNVYIGFGSYPADGNLIIKFAAVKGNEATDFGCHIWAVPANQISHPPYYGTMSGKWYDEATARYGRIE